MATPLASSSRRPDDPNFPPALHITASRAPQLAGGGGGVADAEEADGAIYADEADIAAYGIAGRIWEAAYLLRLYLRPLHPLLLFAPACPLFAPNATAVRLVELGAGVGYAGLHLARQLAAHGDTAAHLVLTDLHNVLPLLERNVRRADAGRPQSRCRVEVMPLPWGDAACAHEVRRRLLESSSSSSEPITHILCSDLVYFPELLAPLLRTLLHLTERARGSGGSGSGRGPTVVIAYKIRSLEKEAPFWHAFGSWFDFEPVLCRRRRRGRRGAEEWERFGAKLSHFASPDGRAAGDVQTDHSGPPGEEEEEQAEEEEDAPDQYFLFLASRRADTQGALAPADDAQLLQGWRIWPSSSSEHAPRGAARQEGDSSLAAARQEAGHWEMGSGGERFEELLFLALGGG